MKSSWMYFVITSIKIYRCQCNQKKNALDLALSESFAPGMYFPNTNEYTQENAVKNTGTPLFSNQAVTANSPQQNMPAYQQNSNCKPNGNFSYAPFNKQAYNNVGFSIPSQVNSSFMSMPVSPFYAQPPGNKSFAEPCDNSLERNKFSECVKNALASLRNILENCKKTLGEDAKECCIDERCLDSLKKKKEKCMSDAIDKALSKRKDTLSEFLDFLKKEIQSKGKLPTKKNDAGKAEGFSNNCETCFMNTENSTSSCKDPCIKT